MTDRERLIKIAQIVAPLALYQYPEVGYIPRKNTTKRECYEALAKIQPLVEGMATIGWQHRFDLEMACWRYRRQLEGRSAVISSQGMMLFDIMSEDKE